MTINGRILHCTAALLALGGLATSAAAVPASSRLCRIMTLLRCSPDLCVMQRLPGTAALGDVVPSDPFVAGRRTSVSYNPARRSLSLCWDGRCSNSTALAPWRSGRVFGATGAIREEFERGQPTNASFSATFEQRLRDQWLYYSMTIHPNPEQDDYYVLNGNCEPTS